jgi:hypothetical protein
MTLDQLTEFFRLMLLINMGVLVFSFCAMLLMKRPMHKLHESMFGISESQVNISAYAFLGAYKVLIIVFNLVPYIALLLLAA